MEGSIKDITLPILCAHEYISEGVPEVGHSCNRLPASCQLRLWCLNAQLLDGTRAPPLYHPSLMSLGYTQKLDKFTK